MYISIAAPRRQQAPPLPPGWRCDPGTGRPPRPPRPPAPPAAPSPGGGPQRPDGDESYIRLCYVYPADSDAEPTARRRLARVCRYTGLDGRPCDEPEYLADVIELEDMRIGGGR